MNTADFWIDLFAESRSGMNVVRLEWVVMSKRDLKATTYLEDQVTAVFHHWKKTPGLNITKEVAEAMFAKHWNAHRASTEEIFLWPKAAIPS